MTNSPHPHKKAVSWRTIGIIAGVMLILSILLLLDLRAQGVMWRFFWSKTGEEDSAGQILGMVQWAGNAIRPAPETAPHVPIAHTDAQPFSINTFLHQEAEEAKRAEQLRLLTEAGFSWIREEFPWEDIEVHGRGNFMDSRNDYTGDGVPDPISSWIKYDNIVDLTEQYGVTMLVRLSNPPTWSRSDPEIGDQAPPDDFDDFVNYAVTVAERYKGRVHHYQVWNEPNIYPEWGNQRPDPAAYTDLLCRTYHALKAVDPEIVVVSGAIAPTQALVGYDYQDLVYLTNLYELGAGDCFDVLAAQGYGLFSGPTDRRLRFNQFGYQRHILYRDIMVRYGDADKAIWLSEAAWNPVLDAALPREQIDGFSRFGEVTQEQAARYMPIAYQRAQEEWPWIGQVSYWFMTRPTHFEANQSYYYFRMVEPDYSEDHPTFTPLLIYAAMKDYIQQRKQYPILYAGRHQAESWEITAEDDAVLQGIDEAEVEAAIETSYLSFNAQGTHTLVRIKTDHSVDVVRDGTFYETPIEAGDGWQTVTIYHSRTSQNHNFILESDQTFLVDSILIVDRTWEQVTVPIIVMIGIGLALLLRVAITVIARSNHG